MACCSKPPPSAELSVADSRWKPQPTPDLPYRKAILIGDAGVGKTCFLNRLRHGEWVDPQKATIGVEFFKPGEGIPYSGIQFWDTAGMERYRAIVRSYYLQASLLIAFFDLTDSKSLESLDRWIKEAFDYGINGRKEKLVLMIIGTKSDLIDEEKPRVAFKGLGRKVVEAIDFYAELSTKTDPDIDSGYYSTLVALEEFSKTGDIQKAYTERMRELGLRIKPSEKK